MENDIVVTVNGLQPGDMWPLPPDRVDELAELLINSMIRHRQEKRNHEHTDAAAEAV